jgi:hypothetical protein
MQAVNAQEVGLLLRAYPLTASDPRFTRCHFDARGTVRELDKIRERGDRLAVLASMRILAAQIVSPKDPGEWFTAVGQGAFEYVDGISNPHLDESTVKEASYDTLRMIFDPTGFES